MRKVQKPKVYSTGKSIEDYINQIETVRYVDEWPATDRQLEEVPQSKISQMI